MPKHPPAPHEERMQLLFAALEHLIDFPKAEMHRTMAMFSEGKYPESTIKHWFEKDETKGKGIVATYFQSQHGAGKDEPTARAASSAGVRGRRRATGVDIIEIAETDDSGSDRSATLPLETSALIVSLLLSRSRTNNQAGGPDTQARKSSRNSVKKPKQRANAGANEEDGDDDDDDDARSPRDKAKVSRTARKKARQVGFLSSD